MIPFVQVWMLLLMQNALQTADEILTHHPEVKMVKQEELRERVGKKVV